MEGGGEHRKVREHIQTSVPIDRSGQANVPLSPYVPPCTTPHHGTPPRAAPRYAAPYIK
jgi:hypothetical protein